MATTPTEEERWPMLLLGLRVRPRLARGEPRGGDAADIDRDACMLVRAAAAIQSWSEKREEETLSLFLFRTCVQVSFSFYSRLSERDSTPPPPKKKCQLFWFHVCWHSGHS